MSWTNENIMMYNNNASIELEQSVDRDDNGMRLVPDADYHEYDEDYPEPSDVDEEKVPGWINPTDELVEAVADRVVTRLMPVFNRLENSASGGMLYGKVQIGKYMKSGKFVGSSGSVTNWYKNSGLPLSKTPSGVWVITKAMIDKWLFDRSVITRKANELGFKIVNGTGKDGLLGNMPPEKLSIDQVLAVKREILKDRGRMAIGD
jgi:hypothetical protein